jgi:hypothetical protein
MVATVCQQPTSNIGDYLMLAEKVVYCITHILDFEGEDFSDLLRSPDYESWGLEPEGIPQEEWNELREAYLELKKEGWSGGNDYVIDRIFDRLAECSSGHVYCSAVRASKFLKNLSTN